MPTFQGLGQHPLIAFLPIVDVDRAKAFYRDTLGLRLLSEELPFALVFDAHGIMLRLAIGSKRPSTVGTVLGWQVPDIESAVRHLHTAKVHFEQYPYMLQDDLGIWTTPTGSRVAWFKDPDGNLLSISQHPELTQANSQS